jgi:uncharacterized protein (TIGR04562 family)
MLESYGFHWLVESERLEAGAIREEALAFLLEELLHDEPELTISQEVVDEEDVRKLLLWASADPLSPRQGERQRWSCALLRVMHTFVHCGSYFQQVFSDQIRSQILDRFDGHINGEGKSLTLGAGPDAIPLVEFQFRTSKSRRSLAMKLLMKAENVGADIFDWVGLRFVTHERFDALLVVKYLRRHNLTMFANVKPGRSRNTLLDPGTVKKHMALVDDLIRSGKLAEHQRVSEIRRLVREEPFPHAAERSYNPFSASSYHSIQFTCSQQVRVENPYLGSGVNRVLGAFDKTVPQALRRRLKGGGVSRDVHFFFPYEVQIMDVEAFEASRSGRASHEVYKERQRYAVKKRLFGEHFAGKMLRRTQQFRAIDLAPITGS